MNTILFDLDGTLLPMDVKEFERIYFSGLCKAFPRQNAKQLLNAVMQGVRAMVQNDGRRTNREAFIPAFEAAAGMAFEENEEAFLEFYRTGFQLAKNACTLSPLSLEIVETLQNKGYTVAIATNPLFPQTATYSRLSWLGLDPARFPLVTTYENSHYAKPSPAYFAEVAAHLHAAPANCVMIGNDVEEDGAAASTGMTVMLVTDCLINEKALPTQGLWCGSLQQLLAWAQALPCAE